MAERTNVNIPSSPPSNDLYRVKVAHTSLPLGEIERGERRLEGERYLLGGYALARRVKAVPSAALTDFAEVWQPGRLKGITVSSEHGVPYFTATQAFDIRPNARKWLAASHVDDIEELYVEPGWILVTRSGTVGDAIISYAPHIGVIISDDMLRVQLRNPAHLGYIYGFLRSRFARSMLISDQYGSIIKHLEPEHVQKLLVPLPGEDVYEPLSKRVKSVYRLRDEAFNLTVHAEAMYAAELGGDSLSLPEDVAFSVAASTLFPKRRRLDGFHYNPRARRALVALYSGGRPVPPLSSLGYEVFGVPRFKHMYSSEGIPYLDSEDIFKVGPNLTKFIPAIHKRDADSYYVKRGWLLMACSGQIYGLNGRVILADAWHENKILSNHVVRIVPPDNADSVPAGYIKIVLGHPVFGRPLVVRWAFGTEVPEIDPDDLSDFPVVRLDANIEEEIGAQVERANILNRQAAEEEDALVAHVEQMVAKAIGVG
jgi:hypothetical protein